MKKVISLIVILIITILSGCTNSSDYVPPDQYGKNQNKTIMECIESRDIARLKSILSPYMQKQEDIDEKIEKLFDFIDGNIISYDEPGGSVQSKESTPQGITLEALSGCTRNIVTDAGKKYEVEFYSYYINKEHADYVGVSMIVIYDRDIYNEENNYPQEGVYGIYLEE